MSFTNVIAAYMRAPLTLILDDDPNVARVTNLVFKAAGIKTLVATTATEAVSIWNSHKDEIALFVTEYELGGFVTGEQLVQIFLCDCPSLKSIILSSSSPSESVAKGRVEGMNFFQKPWSGKAVIAAARMLLENRAPTESS